MNAGDNRLPILADTIRAAAGAMRRTAIESPEAALAAGLAFLEAKALVPHGAWSAWIEANCTMSERTDQRLMALARSGLKPATAADFGVRGASALLAGSRLLPFGADEQMVVEAGEQLPCGLFEHTAVVRGVEPSRVHIRGLWFPAHKETGEVISTRRPLARWGLRLALNALFGRRDWRTEIVGRPHALADYVWEHAS